MLIKQTKDTVFNIVGFDLPALDNWRLRIKIELDLFKLQPEVRQSIIARIEALYTDLESFKDSLSRARVDDSAAVDPNLPAVLAAFKDALSMADGTDLLVIEANGQRWGGERNVTHNKIGARAGWRLNLVPEANLKNLVLEYVDGNEIQKVPVPLFSVADPNLQLKMPALIYHDKITEFQSLHNTLVSGVKKLNELSPDIIERYSLAPSHVGRGVIKAYERARIPDPDGFPAKIIWRGSLALLTNVETVPTASLNPVLLKAKVKDDEISVKTLFTDARTKRAELFNRAGVISKLLDSEYYVPEQMVHLTRPHRGRKIIEKGIVKRPNMRVEGLLEVEVEHNKSAAIGGLPVVEYYFDSNTATTHEAFKEIKDPSFPDGSVSYRVATPIPAHGIDVFDVELALQQQELNKKSEQKVSYEDDLRPMLAPVYQPDWRFEEIIDGLYMPAVELARKAFLDPKTGEPLWKYSVGGHCDRLSVSNVQRRVVVIRARPADEFAFKRVFSLLTDAFMRNNESLFLRLAEDKALDSAINSLALRVPELAEEIIDTLKLDLPELKELLASITTEKSFTNRNLGAIENAFNSYYRSYRELIEVYPYAHFAPKASDGFFYTQNSDGGDLDQIGLLDEDPQLMNDRKDLEHKLRLLEVAVAKLNLDKQQARPRYLKRKPTQSPQPIIKEKKPTAQQESRMKRASEDLKEIAATWVKSGYAAITSRLKDHARRSKMREWGHSDLANSDGNPIIFLKDWFSAVAEVSPSWEKFGGHVQQLLPSMPEDSPENEVVSFIVQSKQIGETIANALSAYYNDDVSIEQKKIDEKKIMISVIRNPRAFAAELINKFMSEPRDVDQIKNFVADLKQRAIEPAIDSKEIDNIVIEVRGEMDAIDRQIESEKQKTADLLSLKEGIEKIIQAHSKTIKILSFEIDGLSVRIQTSKEIPRRQQLITKLENKYPGLSFDFNVRTLEETFSL